MKKRLYIAFLLLVSVGSTVFTQQLPLYSQFFMTRFLINPARAGAYGATSIELTAREQWVGFKGAPSTHALAFQSRLVKKSYMGGMRSARSKGASKGGGSRVGFGGYIFNDKSGLIDYSGVQGTYAYHVRIKKSQLSFGVSANIFQFRLDEENIILYDKNDQLLNDNKKVFYFPDAAVGVYYVFPRFYSGISATNLFQSSIKFGNVSFKESQVKRHYYGMCGYNIKLDKKYSVEPSVLIKSDEQFRMQADLNVRGFFMNNYWGGLSYRTSSFNNVDVMDLGAVVFLAGVSIEQFQFGYAFDLNMNSIQKYNYGSHEINLGVTLGDNARRYRWIDRY